MKAAISFPSSTSVWVSTSRWVWSMTASSLICCPSDRRAPRRFLPSTASTRRRSLRGSDACPSVAAAASRQASTHAVNAASTATESTAIRTRRIVAPDGGRPHTPTAGLAKTAQSAIAA
jgi:hypothetical protein